jgi:iron complex transport system ATP-binding protein
MSESVSRQAPDGSYADRVGTQPQPVYDLHAVHFRYRSDAANQAGWVLDDVSLRIHAGEMLGIVGPNGSGKSSLLKVLARLIRPQQGRVCLFGQDLADMSQESSPDWSASFPRTASSTSHLRWQKPY